MIAGWGSHEADLPGLDETTYRHHLTQTLLTLTDHAPDAACVVMGPVAKQEAARVELVRSVQRAVASQLGCAYFDPDKAFSERPAKNIKTGLVKRGRVTAKGYRQIADTLLSELLGWHDYAQAKRAQDRERAEEEEAKQASASNPPAQDAATQDAAAQDTMEAGPKG